MYNCTFNGSHLREVTDADDDNDNENATVQPLGHHIANDSTSVISCRRHGASHE